jgi:hypothetical protein
MKFGFTRPNIQFIPVRKQISMLAKTHAAAVHGVDARTIENEYPAIGIQLQV